MLNRELVDAAESGLLGIATESRATHDGPGLHGRLSTMPTGRQCSTLNPYIIRSTSSPLGAKASAPARRRSGPFRRADEAAHRAENRHRIGHVMDALHGKREVVPPG